MAALVSQDAPVAAGFSHPAAEIRADAAEVARLYDALDGVSERDNPRTARLLSCSRSKIAQKLIEEAGEIALEAVRHRSRSVVRESDDLIYHLVVLWHECGITPDEVWAEMQWRADKLGLAEKLPKSPGRHASAPECGK
ncbi:MAG TPA: phosphoribosyl-ATP diphosphatase [Stellaceae bacterium]|jgi:phosphoribosyl-ATP pyrophosphohydrolase|nr:phosphoribosyl-ATP diphosphatase [Stellaceae bacterium]